jgi:hypothetical protein
MITLPDGFDVGVLFNQLFQLTAPFAGIAFLIACGFVVQRLIKMAPQ